MNFKWIVCLLILGQKCVSRGTNTTKIMQVISHQRLIMSKAGRFQVSSSKQGLKLEAGDAANYKRKLFKHTTLLERHFPELSVYIVGQYGIVFQRPQTNNGEKAQTWKNAINVMNYNSVELRSMQLKRTTLKYH